MNRLEGTVVDALTRRILESAFEVHAQLGPGLLENVYAVCLAAELRSNGLEVATEVPIPVSYKNIQLEAAYRADLLVEKSRCSWSSSRQIEYCRCMRPKCSRT